MERKKKTIMITLIRATVTVESLNIQQQTLSTGTAAALINKPPFLTAPKSTEHRKR